MYVEDRRRSARRLRSSERRGGGRGSRRAGGRSSSATAISTGTSCATSTRRRPHHRAVVVADQARSERRASAQLPLDGPGRQPLHLQLPDLVLRQPPPHRSARARARSRWTRWSPRSSEAGQRFLVNSLMEEAIRSSQLEGATTSRSSRQGDAAERPRAEGPERADDRQQLPGASVHARGDGRRPDAGRRSSNSTASSPREPSTTRQRLAGCSGPGKSVCAVFDRDDGDADPRAAAGRAASRADAGAFATFANEGDDGERFVHPVVRAILLHFWLAYDHPFEDGNGRTARILFFWLMRSRGYWLAEYLPISRLHPRRAGADTPVLSWKPRPTKATPPTS